MNDIQKDITEARMKLIAPLLSPGMDRATRQRLKEKICEETGLSERTLRRYLARYEEMGFEGLKPRPKQGRTGDAVPDDILQEAILLRRQVPTRSVSQLIQILEWEGKVEQGQIKRSTLQEKLAKHGYSTRQMKQYRQTGSASRRFQQPHRNNLWQSDIKYALHLPLGKNNKLQQVYLVTWLDDATRFILHSEFYPSLEKAIVVDSFKKAILKHGVPDCVYFDNGSQYRNKWMRDTTGLLGIKLLFAKPYHPEGKGKAEVFHQRVDSFLAEAKLENIGTLTEFNHLYQVWLDECYQHQPHRSLKKGHSPASAYQSDPHPVRFVDPKEVHAAFLHREERRVDKTGCISFYGKPYEVGLSFLGMKVEVIYDPMDTSVITVKGGDLPPVQARQRIIGSKVGPRPALPEHLTPEPAHESRLLKAAVKKHTQRPQPMLISYRKEGEPDV